LQKENQRKKEAKSKELERKMKQEEFKKRAEEINQIQTKWAKEKKMYLKKENQSEKKF
jgi:hypothetical protein